ncbi:hypothetical protein BC832DRAFT_143123 [Gaertneriomyces semiglobifer]|nr:hypothetical protein BC832DRAFT_143123 [Gaertneriomyces semiglobifer]
MVPGWHRGRLLAYGLATAAAFACSSVSAAPQAPDNGGITPQCTGSPYTGDTCKITGFVYDVLTPAAAIAAADEKIAQVVKQLHALQVFDPTCYGYMFPFACATAFPGCIEGKPAILCESNCQFTRDACEATSNALGLQGFLPNCTAGAQVGTSVIPYPQTDCLAVTVPGGQLKFHRTEPKIALTASPAQVYNEGVPSENIILAVLYILSFLGFLDIISVFGRMRRSYSVISWAVSWVIFILIILAGQIVHAGDINRAFGSSFCRNQALVITYVTMMSYLWPVFFTLDVWFAVVQQRLRSTSEGARWKWNALVAFTLPLWPVIVQTLKANPASLTPPENLQPGFSPHVLFCSYTYPINGWVMSTLPFAFMCAGLATLCGIHAAVRLYKQRKIFESTNQSASREGASVVSSNGKRSRAASRISALLCLRVLLVTFIFIIITIAANYQQVRATVRDRYAESDASASFRDFVASCTGILGWLVLCTSQATWKYTVPGMLSTRLSGERDSSQSDSTPLAALRSGDKYDQNEYGRRGPYKSHTSQENFIPYVAPQSSHNTGNALWRPDYDVLQQEGYAGASARDQSNRMGR